MYSGKYLKRCRLVGGLLLGVTVACGSPQPDTMSENPGGPPNGGEQLVREVPPWFQPLSMLEDPAAGTTERVAAIEALGDSVVHALREVQGPLIEALGDQERDIGLTAERTIRRIRDDVAVALITASEEPRRRPWALRLLSGVTVTEEWLDSFVESMGSGNYRRRLWAVRVGGALAAENPGALNVLRTGLVDSEAVVRIEALEAVATAGSDAAALVEEVTSALDDGDIAVQEAACFALAALGASAKIAVPALQRTARNSNGRLAQAARGALEVID